jgi:hypothetical protein
LASAKEVPPGGESKIDVTFKTGSGSSGKREKHIAVTTNDPEQQAINLTISAEVVEAIGISPNRITFNQVKKGLEHVRYASLSGDDKDKTKLTGAESSNPNIKVELNPKGYDDDKYRQIKIILLPTIRAGRFFDKVTIHTDHKDMKDVQLDIMGDVTGDIVVMPNQLHFGLFQKGKQLERVIVLKATENVNFKVLEIKSSIPEVTTSLETVEAGKEYRLHAQLKDGFTGDSIKGTLTLTTDLKNDNIIPIDILGRMLPPSASGNGPESLPPFVKEGQQPPVKQGTPGNLPPFLKDGNTPPAPVSSPMPPTGQPSGSPPPFIKNGQAPIAPPDTTPR